MFLNKNYILANELVQKMNIHIANISMLRQQYEDCDDFSTITKMNNCSMINSKSFKLPNNIKVGILANDFTDLSNKLPCTYVRSEYDVTERELMGCGIVKNKLKICGKDFYEFTDEFVKNTKNKLIYVLDKKETEECYEKGQICGYVQLSKNKFLVWY